jgi:hypothetical protein
MSNHYLQCKHSPTYVQTLKNKNSEFLIYLQELTQMICKDYYLMFSMSIMVKPSGEDHIKTYIYILVYLHISK